MWGMGFNDINIHFGQRTVCWAGILSMGQSQTPFGCAGKWSCRVCVSKLVCWGGKIQQQLGMRTPFLLCAIHATPVNLNTHHDSCHLQLPVTGSRKGTISSDSVFPVGWLACCANFLHRNAKRRRDVCHTLGLRVFQGSQTGLIACETRSKSYRC